MKQSLITFTKSLVSVCLISAPRFSTMSLSKLKPVTLITFDVDGTLVSSTGGSGPSTHGKAFIEAMSLLSLNQDSFSACDSPLQFIASERYHGSTDGLILLNLIKSALDIQSEIAAPRLPELYNHMHKYFARLTDEEVSRDVYTLPGVIDTLTKIAQSVDYDNNVLCGLVTGNVEGIARKKMRACGILQTKILSKLAATQTAVWEGEEESSFLGGFGSDFCSEDIDDVSRQYKDRGEQIAIAYRRACSLLRPDQQIVRVVHVGDAPADILAARWCCEEKKFTLDAEGADKIEEGNVVVGCVGVATGKYSAEHLSSLVGATVPGKWEPVVLAEGLNDPEFIASCGIVRESS